MDRRTSIKWVLGAAVALPLVDPPFAAGAVQGAGPTGAGDAAAGSATAKGYGTDPDLLKAYRPGDAWPLTLTAAQRRTTGVLCDIIIPQDAHSPSASSVGVVDFLDEWISAPYPAHRLDRKLMLDGLAWLEAHSAERFGKPFTDLTAERQAAICDDICYLPKAAPQYRQAAVFFARFRDLTAGGFYTTPLGRTDIGFVGNVPRATFDGPPLEVLRKVGLA